jgi:SRSO17 transposase
VKKGVKSAGVQRQYCGRVGKIENCQMGVFLGCISPSGHAFLDRELYLPETWCADGVRREAAQIPAEIVFQTKPQLVARMLERAWAEGFALAWVVGDSTYGNSPELRRRIDQAARHYVLEVAQTLGVITPTQPRQSVAELTQNTPAQAWQTFILNCGEKGLISADWLHIPIQLPNDATGVTGLLVRRASDSPTELTYFVTNAPPLLPMAELVHVAASRYHIEQLFAEAKGSAGLADYEGRTWHSWYRHITLSLIAHTWLTLIRQTLPKKKA